MPRNSSMLPAVTPRTGPSPVGTTGPPPEPEATAAAPLAPVAARVSAASAAQQAAASRARRQWVVFMILTPSVSPVAHANVSRVAACRGDTPPSETLARCGLAARGGGHAHPRWLLPRRRERSGLVVGPVDGQLALRMGSARRLGDGAARAARLG